MIDKTEGQRMQQRQGPYLLVVLCQMIAYNLYYHQSDIYLSCHAILAIANKSIYGYILKNTDNYQLESSDRLAKDSEVGQGLEHET